MDPLNRSRFHPHSGRTYHRRLDRPPDSMAQSPRRSRSSWWILLTLGSSVVAIVVGISFAQEIQRRVALQRHVHQLQEEIQRREEKVATLQQFTEYLKTDAYQERAAREKLNYQRPGENVVVIPESGRVLEAEEARVENQRPALVSVPRQWWDRLFGSVAP